jgi:hypothetical protein
VRHLGRAGRTDSPRELAGVIGFHPFRVRLRAPRVTWGGRTQCRYADPCRPRMPGIAKRPNILACDDRPPSSWPGGRLPARWPTASPRPSSRGRAGQHCPSAALRREVASAGSVRASHAGLGRRPSIAAMNRLPLANLPLDDQPNHRATGPAVVSRDLDGSSPGPGPCGPRSARRNRIGDGPPLTWMGSIRFARRDRNGQCIHSQVTMTDDPEIWRRPFPSPQDADGTAGSGRVRHAGRSPARDGNAVSDVRTSGASSCEDRGCRRTNMTIRHTAVKIRHSAQGFGRVCGSTNSST